MKWLVHFAALVPHSGLDHVLKSKYAMLQVLVILANFYGNLRGNRPKLEIHMITFVILDAQTILH